MQVLPWLHQVVGVFEMNNMPKDNSGNVAKFKKADAANQGSSKHCEWGKYAARRKKPAWLHARLAFLMIEFLIIELEIKFQQGGQWL